MTTATTVSPADYFRLAEMRGAFEEPDGWLCRRRLVLLLVVAGSRANVKLRWKRRGGRAYVEPPRNSRSLSGGAF